MKVGWSWGLCALTALAVGACFVQTTRLRQAKAALGASVEREQHALALHAKLQASLNYTQMAREQKERQHAAAVAELTEAKARLAALQMDLAQLQAEAATARAQAAERDAALKALAEVTRQPVPAVASAEAAPAARIVEATVLARSGDGRVIALAPVEAFSPDQPVELTLANGRRVTFHPTRTTANAMIGWIEPEEASSTLDPGSKVRFDIAP